MRTGQTMNATLRHVQRVLTALAATLGLVTVTMIAGSPPASGVTPSAALKLVTPTNPVLKGSTATVRAVFPSAGRRTAYLQSATVGSKSWTRVANSTKTTSKGVYQYSFKPSTTKQYRVLMPAASSKLLRLSSTLRITVVPGWRQVTTGLEHTCGIRGDGAAFCWGNNGAGQVGNSINSGSGIPVRQPLQVATPAGKTWKSLSAGGDHTCGILSDDSLRCFGNNSGGALGVATNFGTDAANSAPAVVGVNGITRWAAVSAGDDFSCAVSLTGALYCWGENDFGQTGTNGMTTWEPRKVASPVPEVQRWRSVSAGGIATCALLDNGSAWCFGNNIYGQVGRALTEVDDTYETPTQVAGSWATISVGGSFVCARRTNGIAQCWGRNDVGQLARSAGQLTSVPQLPGDLNAPFDTASTLVSSGGTSACGIMPNRTLWCWGDNDSSQIGTGVGGSVPSQLGGTTWRTIDAGVKHTCGLLIDHRLFCFGDNSRGELANDTLSSSANPLLVPAP